MWPAALGTWWSLRCRWTLWWMKRSSWQCRCSLPGRWCSCVGTGWTICHYNRLVVWNIFKIFPYIGNNNPNWLIFFRGVQTTNQIRCLSQTQISWKFFPNLYGSKGPKSPSACSRWRPRCFLCLQRDTNCPAALCVCIYIYIYNTYIMTTYDNIWQYVTICDIRNIYVYIYIYTHTHTSTSLNIHACISSGFDPAPAAAPLCPPPAGGEPRFVRREHHPGSQARAARRPGGTRSCGIPPRPPWGSYGGWRLKRGWAWDDLGIFLLWEFMILWEYNIYGGFQNGQWWWLWKMVNDG